MNAQFSPVAGQEPETVIRVEDVTTRFGDTIVHDRISFSVRRGEVMALAGGSGCGKSTLLREIIMLHRPDSGRIQVLGQDVLNLNHAQALAIKRRCGVMFQHGALFSAMTVLENVGAPLREFTRFDSAFIDELSCIRLGLVGLSCDTGAKYPSELSGGMRKRVAMARALALDPELLFLDEPTAGLDPVSAGGIDELVTSLKELLGLTIIVVTHDLDTLWNVVDRVAILGEGRVLAVDDMEGLSHNPHPLIQEYFTGPRGQVIRGSA